MNDQDTMNTTYNMLDGYKRREQKWSRVQRLETWWQNAGGMLHSLVREGLVDMAHDSAESSGDSVGHESV